MNISKFFIDENCTIIHAMKQLDDMATKVLFLQENGILKATLTDGDIRRWILSKGDLNVTVKTVANYNPLYLVHGSYEQALQFMKTKNIEAVPLVDNNLKILDIIPWYDMHTPIVYDQLCVPVVMMAGGKGTRLYPYTKILPKALIPIGELPIAEHIIQEFKKYGCQNYYLIVNHKRNMIKAYFNEIDKDYNVFYIDENRPLGTGGGLSLLKGKIHETFILTNCDILIKEDIGKIYHYHKEHKNVITMVCSLKNIQLPYGTVQMKEGGYIESMQEKPEISFLTNTGCYIVEPRIINELESYQVISFPEIIEKYRNNNYSVGVYPIGEHAWLDMGQKDELERMRKELGIT